MTPKNKGINEHPAKSEFMIFLIKHRNPGPLGLRLVDPTARRARSEIIGFACNSFKE
jgi:hypothetical protein